MVANLQVIKPKFPRNRAAFQIFRVLLIYNVFAVMVSLVSTQECVTVFSSVVVTVKFKWLISISFQLLTHMVIDIAGTCIGRLFLVCSSAEFQTHLSLHSPSVLYFPIAVLLFPTICSGKER